MKEATFAPSKATQFTVNQQPPHTVRRKSPYSQAIELQDLLMKDARESKLKPVSRAIVARAWRDLEQLKREIKMKPKPKPVDVAAIETEKRRRQRQAEEFAGPMEAQEAPPPADQPGQPGR
jgi:hypothetical protein